MLIIFVVVSEFCSELMFWVCTVLMIIMYRSGLASEHLQIMRLSGVTVNIIKEEGIFLVRWLYCSMDSECSLLSRGMGHARWVSDFFFSLIITTLGIHIWLLSWIYHFHQTSHNSLKLCLASCVDRVTHCLGTLKQCLSLFAGCSYAN